MCHTMTNTFLNFMIDGLWFGLVCTYKSPYLNVTLSGLYINIQIVFLYE